MNLRMTDIEAQGNIDVVGASIDKVAFVRNASYLTQLSELVKKSESEVVTLQKENSQ
jgi:hypothetical protein